jgi:hypothetical protein
MHSFGCGKSADGQEIFRRLTLLLRLEGGHCDGANKQIEAEAGHKVVLNERLYPRSFSLSWEDVPR